eukprot:TRINITY_DN34224_c0_g1_i1.p1 TRINITY_DN34224_c0_g1~~TRINITY_DN34224_c0_g1_i1.p1  ORF type:complete len:273 (+),score=32.83 TRINITY_DN34224_c0_g1_i1:23-841(+)
MKQPTCISVFISLPDLSQTCVDVECTGTVLDLKDQISSMTGHAKDSYSLHHEAEELENSMPICECLLDAQTTLTMRPTPKVKAKLWLESNGLKNCRVEVLFMIRNRTPDDEKCSDILTALIHAERLCKKDSGNIAAIYSESITRRYVKCIAVLIENRLLGVDDGVFHMACAAGLPSVVLLLLQHGADPNSRAPSGIPQLHLAVQLNRCEVVRHLLACGADPNLKNPDGDTPLHLSMFFRYPAITSNLLMSGADPTIEDPVGCTPYDRALPER